MTKKKSVDIKKALKGIGMEEVFSKPFQKSLWERIKDWFSSRGSFYEEYMKGNTFQFYHHHNYESSTVMLIAVIVFVLALVWMFLKYSPNYG